MIVKNEGDEVKGYQNRLVCLAEETVLPSVGEFC
jgi:hypothetical protein